tara:strand:+ start:656 stop:994 length:339 start_codon:yes stop_codon:yes gene_type:complete
MGGSSYGAMSVSDDFKPGMSDCSEEDTTRLGFKTQTSITCMKVPTSPLFPMFKKEPEEETVLEYKFSPRMAIKEGVISWDKGKTSISIPVVDPKEQKAFEKRFSNYTKKQNR